ncbi:hypothetical protein N7G274_008951 [Stereocaulon virgatum]|uniref:Uncharacterized protein n=1 Tax=Stereocaulon virgatum TaxID=373712 RepID=A0ABR3ZXB9_9LECA
MGFTAPLVLMDASLTRDGLMLGPLLHIISFVTYWNSQDAIANVHILSQTLYSQETGSKTFLALVLPRPSSILEIINDILGRLRLGLPNHVRCSTFSPHLILDQSVETLARPSTNSTEAIIPKFQARLQGT